MKKSLPFLTLSFLLLVSLLTNAQAFPWSAYVSGSKSYSKTVNGNSMSVAVTGSGFSTGYPAYISDGSFLATSVDWSNKTTTVTYTITFSTAVNGVSFNVYDVDQTSTWDDKVTITGTNSTGTTIYPTISATSYSTLSGSGSIKNIIEGNNDNVTFTNSPAVVSFGLANVKSITMVYGVGANSPSNPNVQIVGFGQIQYNSILPLNLLSFTGKSVSDNVSLAWITDEQINFDHFEIEKATATGFEKIATVKGISGLTGNYSYTDYHVVSASNIASYRLKMIDQDGGYTYSSIISVKITGQVNVDVRPTLVNSSEPVSVIIASANNARYDINMYSMDGRIVAQKRSVSAGTVSFETNNLVKGIYIIKVGIGDATNSFRVVVK